MRLRKTASTFKPGLRNGFTLIELMIVVAIIAILAAITYPSYQQFVLRGKRAEGRAALLDAAAKEERYYSDNNQYGTLAAAGIPATTESNYYNISITLANANQDFTLTADPIFADPLCDNLTLNQAGTRTENGTSTDLNDCWGK
jgi:type IV pilus assembly protein PilE